MGTLYAYTVGVGREGKERGHGKEGKGMGEKKGGGERKCKEAKVK